MRIRQGIKSKTSRVRSVTISPRKLVEMAGWGTTAITGMSPKEMVYFLCQPREPHEMRCLTPLPPDARIIHAELVDGGGQDHVRLVIESEEFSMIPEDTCIPSIPMTYAYRNGWRETHHDGRRHVFYEEEQ